MRCVSLLRMRVLPGMPTRGGEKDSYGIGIRNIRTMTKEMGGDCEVMQNENSFRICLRFRYKKE